MNEIHRFYPVRYLNDEDKKSFDEVEQYFSETQIYKKIDDIKIKLEGQYISLNEAMTTQYDKLSKKFMCDYDEAGSIGKRYRREDEIGTPYCVTIDFDTLEDESVTIRDRDTMEQVRVKIDDLTKWLEEKMEF